MESEIIKMTMEDIMNLLDKDVNNQLNVWKKILFRTFINEINRHHNTGLLYDINCILHEGEMFTDGEMYVIAYSHVDNKEMHRYHMMIISSFNVVYNYSNVVDVQFKKTFKQLRDNYIAYSERIIKNIKASIP